MLDRMSEYLPSTMPENMSAYLLDREPEKMSDRISRYMSLYVR
jgi:hypothetical protein